MANLNILYFHGTVEVEVKVRRPAGEVGRVTVIGTDDAGTRHEICFFSDEVRGCRFQLVAVADDGGRPTYAEQMAEMAAKIKAEEAAKE